MSWFASRIITNQSSAAFILENLKASALGLGGADCDEKFKCDPAVIRAERKKRRRKRSVEKYRFEWNI